MKTKLICGLQQPLLIDFGYYWLETVIYKHVIRYITSANHSERKITLLKELTCLQLISIAAAVFLWFPIVQVL